MPQRSASITNFSYPSVRPPSSHPCRLQDEVGPGQQSRRHRIGGFLHGLRIGDLRSRVVAATAEGQAEPSGDLADGIGGQRRLGGPERRRT